MYFDMLKLGLLKCHVVSVASSKIGISGALQHCVLFICCENSCGDAISYVHVGVWAKHSVVFQW